ncbi:Hsp20/alpha crystallin family protein [Hypericibacter adhaerens]|jgi:HSP20 family protein|nr:Hsp20/alpha crystallin family protein [Hypericibacter adhaerens]
MNMRNLIPWNRNGSRAPVLFRDEPTSPFLSLHREVNRLFDETFRSFDVPSLFGPSLFGRLPAWPNLELAETDKELRVTAELPGLDEKDVELLLADGVLTIRGEKRAELDDRERQFSERFYGRFERQIPLGIEIEADKVEASFKNGLLTVTLPKSMAAETRAKRIAINGRK